MTIRKHMLLSTLLAASIAAAIPISVNAMGNAQCPGRRGHGEMMNHEMGLFGGADRLPPFVRELQLTEAQRDQIFKIMHEQAPALREKAKDAQKIHAELRTLGFSANYDEARVKTLTESGAQAMAGIAQMRAASMHQIYELLSPEQRRKAEELKTEFERRGPSDNERAAPKRSR